MKISLKSRNDRFVKRFIISATKSKVLFFIQSSLLQKNSHTETRSSFLGENISQIENEFVMNSVSDSTNKVRSIVSSTVKVVFLPILRLTRFFTKWTHFLEVQIYRLTIRNDLKDFGDISSYERVLFLARSCLFLA